MDTEQAALGGVLDTDQHDPAIQAASAVTGLPQALSPSAEPPWPRDLAETIASFLCPVDALALDASGSATRCVVVERNRHFATNQVFTVSEHRAHRLLPVPLGGARTRVHTVGITLFWRDQGWGNRKGKVWVLRERDRAPNDHGISSEDVRCMKGPAPHAVAHEYMAFRPRAGEEYDFWYSVGGGGGHRLYIYNLGLHRLRYR
jgi:hypothetical protein